MMNWPLNPLKTSFVIFVFSTLTACGVKGDPLPPEKPVELGRGRPTYRKATEGIRIERKSRPAIRDEQESEDQEERDPDEDQN